VKRVSRLALTAGVVVFVLCFGGAARADDLAAVRARGILIWGADQEGGGPYVYMDPDDPTKLVGYEVDLAEAVAAQLGVRAQFSQGQWDKLPDLLRTQKIDIVINGYELDESRADAMEASKPYYVYALQLLARKGEALDWTSLAQRADPKRRVGVLRGSAADTYSAKRLGDAVEIVGYDGNTVSMREVETHKLDATVQDTPIAAFYAPSFPGLEPRGDPVAPGYYVIYARKGERALVAEIDRAVARLLASGELERLYRKYGLWNEQQRALAELHGVTLAPPGAEPTPGSEPAPIVAGPRKRGWAIFRDYGGILVQSAGMTVLLSVVSFPIAIALGLLIAVGRLYGPRSLRPLLVGYVELIRGTPLMLQLFFIFFFLPEIGIRPSAMVTAICGLAINYSAYESEIFRAGLQAVPHGQTEAALALGMSRWSAIVHVVIPQAIRVVIPPVVNDLVALLKDTSVCSVITIMELTKRYSVLSMSTQATVELTFLTALLYLAMSVPLSIAARKLEARLDPKRARA